MYEEIKNGIKFIVSRKNNFLKVFSGVVKKKIICYNRKNNHLEGDCIYV